MRRLPLRIGILLAFTIAVSGWALHSKKTSASQFDTIARTAVIQNIAAAAPQLEQGKSAGSLEPTADDGKIALVTAQLLAHSQYLQHPLDSDMSSKWMDRYLESLDPQHIYFLQSDAEAFDVWRPKLGDMARHGDTSPADQIFARLLERVDQQVAYVNDLLKTETFTFTDNDVYQLDRKSAPRPTSLDDAKQLWKQRLRYEYLQEKLNKQKPEEVVKTLTRRYARLARTSHETDDSDVFDVYMNALAHAYDPHSDYMGRSETEAFNIQMKLSLFGIGALLKSEDGYVKIDELTPGGPALKSGQLKAGDRIVAVAQGSKEPVDVVDMKIDKVVELIRGPKGTEVRLTVLPAGAPDPSLHKTVTLIRDEIKLASQEAKAKVIDMPQANGKTVRMGVIDLPSFYADMDSGDGSHKSATADVARLIKKLEAEKVAGIILDLRRNPGGSLTEAIRLTGLFIKQGPVVQVKDTDGDIQVDKDPDPSVLYDGPLVVLTSRMSASASEILAGALQDYGRALIVGDTSTFGKGTVQTIAPLGSIMKRSGIDVQGDPGELKLTIQKFYRASGASTQLRGVVSDIVLPSLTDYIDVGEKTLDDPLPWDTIPSATYAKLNRVQPVLSELKRRSDARIATEKEFVYLKQEIEQFKKLMAEKSVSLNEQQRLQEKQKAEAQAKQFKTVLAANPDSKVKVYLLTLENLDKPGLPPALTPKAPSPTAQADTPPVDDPLGSLGSDTNAPAVDISLDETERILADMIALSPRQLTGAYRQ